MWRVKTWWLWHEGWERHLRITCEVFREFDSCSLIRSIWDSSSQGKTYFLMRFEGKLLKLWKYVETKFWNLNLKNLLENLTQKLIQRYKKLILIHQK
jgi:hypothetical protein